MPDGHFFSHITAAVIWGLPLPRARVECATIDIGVSPPSRLPRGKGVRGHEVARHLATIERDPHTGLPVASVASTWAMLGSLLYDPYDLIAAGDAAVREWRVSTPLATIAELTARVESGRRVGVGALREALPHLRTRSASRPETRTRLTLVDARLDEPQLNFDVFEAGVWLACVDLAYPHLKIAIEYEGEHHLLDAEQWARDILRYDRLVAAGWRVIRVTKTELFADPRSLVNRVRRAIAERS
jgi:very-short-patch-repair endonuclease